MHYWCGYINYVHGFYKNYYKKFTFVRDHIKINRDLGNHIPHKSWMLYLLEIFNSLQVPVELNLICQFDNQNYFEAIFNGYNKYRFKNILPQINKIYERKIIFEKETSVILYILKDLGNGDEERFGLPIQRSFNYDILQSFTGVEWWNKTEHSTYPIRYEVEISNLMYGLNDDKNDSDSLLFFPIIDMKPNSDGKTMNYPINFDIQHPINQSIHYLLR